MTQQQSKNWIFTLNNPSEPLDFAKLDARSLVYQLEKGENGTFHYQGYICFEKNKRLAAVKKLIPRAHWEIRKGSHQQAIDYCTKSETREQGPWQFGDINQHKGKRSDLLAVKADLDSDKPMSEILSDHFQVSARYHRFFMEYRSVVMPKRNFQTQGVVIYGPPATGKSSWCKEQFPNAYWKDNSKWWSGYSNEETVIIDEYFGWITIHELNRILDSTPLYLETKGGHINFTSKYVFIISNKHPDEWYQNHPPGDVRYEALKSRFAAIKYKPSLTEDFVDEWVNPSPRTGGLSLSSSSSPTPSTPSSPI